ncbi:MAG: hypothetical protein HRU14_18360 [Planctomycetes bacterium]|nr:hypothetical protein [Planctomycetota bacterium]
MFSAAAFIFLIKTGLYPPELRSVNLDVDWVYRRALPRVLQRAEQISGRVVAAFRSTVQKGLSSSVGFIKTHHAPNGVLGEPWPIGTASLWAAVLLVAYLLLAYL